MSRISLHAAPGARQELTLGAPRVGSGFFARVGWGSKALAASVLAASLGGPLACDRETGRGSGVAPASLVGIGMTDQDGRALGASSLAGELLVLNFMFSSCPGPCPRITQLIAKTRELLPKESRERIRFLSITVDPENDTPEVLKGFAKRHAADAPTWRFVRTSAHDLEELALRLTVFDPTGPKAPPAHSTKLYLFDRTGRALQRYDGNLVDAPHLARELLAAERMRSAP